jgi:hypothetical protein
MIGLGLVLVLAAAPAAPPEVRIRGEVREVKSGASIRPALFNEHGSFVLQARRPGLGVELVRLVGATVEVVGREADGGADVEVDGYRLLSVGSGRVPRVGTLARLTTEDGEQLLFVDAQGRADPLPDSWVPRLKDYVGAKLWILGRREGLRFLPTRFQILRAAPEEAGP